MIVLHDFKKHNKNRTLRLKLGDRNYFVKFCFYKDEFRNEIIGYNKIKNIYKLPRRFYYAKFIIIYEYWGSTLKNHGLFCDLISNGDEKEVSTFMNIMTTILLDNFNATAKEVYSNSTVPKLYQDRCKNGDRLDLYYSKNSNLKIFSKAYISSNINININNKKILISLDKIVSDLKSYFSNNFKTISVISQGDPTELNIGNPFTFFDYDTAGRNDIWGEFSNFLWSTFFLSAYIVPLYNPLAYKKHESSLIIKDNLSVQYKELDNFVVSYSLNKNRQQIIGMYIKNVVLPFCQKNNIASIEQKIRPYLLMRIIGVYNIFELDDKIVLFLLLKLSQCLGEKFSIHTFFNDEE